METKGLSLGGKGEEGNTSSENTRDDREWVKSGKRVDRSKEEAKTPAFVRPNDEGVPGSR